MAKKTSWVLFSAAGLLLFAGFLGLQFGFFGEKKDGLNPGKETLVDLAQQGKLKDANGVPVPPPPEDAVRLNDQQKEIASLSTSEIEKELTDLKAAMQEDNLLERLNRNSVNEEERKKAKQILVRIALLNVERSKRIGSKQPNAKATEANAAEATRE